MPSRGGRALVVHAGFDPLGGAEVYAVRVIHILQSMFDHVTVVHTGAPPDLDRIREYSGISLDAGRLQFRTPFGDGPLGKATADRLGGRLRLLHYALAVRAARAIRGGFELTVSTFAECPVGTANLIQTVHVPLFVWDRESLAYCGLSMPPRRRFLHMLYIKFCKWLMGASQDRVSAPLTLANSAWTAEQFRRHYPAARVRPLHFGVDVRLKPGSLDWLQTGEREPGVALIGRVVPEKRVDDAVAIVEAVRAAGHDLRLHIVGSAAPGQTSWLQGLVAGRDWISWRPGLDREALESLVARQRWGLHCYRFEHYGFAPAELQALGCITLVHDSGGQREIVRSPDQRYRDVDDAVRKFLAILRRPERHARLVEEGLGAAAEHTTAKFEREFRSVVEAMLAEPRRGRAQPSAALHPGGV